MNGIIGIRIMLEGYSANLNESSRDWQKVSVQSAKTDCGKKMETVALNSSTYGYLNYSIKFLWTIREIKRMPQLSVNANTLRFKG